MLRTPKKREALPDVLDSRELTRLLRVVERDDVWQRHVPGRRERDRLMLALFAYAGLRKSELLGLDWDDVDLERRLIRVRRSLRARSSPLHQRLGTPLHVTRLRQGRECQSPNGSGSHSGNRRCEQSQARPAPGTES